MTSTRRPRRSPSSTRRSSPLGLASLPPDVAKLLQQGNALVSAALQGGSGSRGKLELAKVYYEKAQARAPDSALVLVALSDVINVLGVRGFSEIRDGPARGA